MARTFGVKNPPAPTNPMMKKRFSAGDADTKTERADRPLRNDHNAPTPPGLAPVAPVVDEKKAAKAEQQEKREPTSAPLSPVEREADAPAPPETAAFDVPRSRGDAAPQAALRVTTQVGIPIDMMDRLEKLAAHCQLDAGYLADAVIAKTLNQIASDGALSTDAVSDPQQKFSLQRRKTFHVDAERFRQVRAKLDPLGIKPAAHIARMIYNGAFAASFEQVLADVSM